MSDVIKDLAAKAVANLLEAQEAVLGYRSGPGIDITIKTTSPATGDRILVPVTEAGLAFINNFYHTRTIPLSELSKFAKLTHEWGLSIHTEWELEEL